MVYHCRCFDYVESDRYVCDSGSQDKCIPCRNLVDLEEKIKQTRAILLGLELERQKLRERANYHHDPFIHRMPVEIAAHIFELCIRGDIMDIDMGRASKYDKYTPLIVSAVCSRWRAIAHSTPRLWAVLPLVCSLDSTYTASGLSTGQIVVDEWLNRTGSLPLSVNFLSNADLSSHWVLPNAQSTVRIIHALNSCSSRWQNFKYEGPPRFLYLFSNHNLPLLRKLDLTLTDDMANESRSLPLHPERLRSLMITARMLFTFMPVDLNWNHLTELQMIYGSLSECFQCVRVMPCLTRCTFELADSHDSTLDVEFPFPEQPIMHYKIQHLLFIGESYEPVYQNFFNYLSCPSLKTLEVAEVDHRIQASHITQFLNRSRCKLERLSLQCNVLDEAGLQSLCEAMPTLLHLDLDLRLEQYYAVSSLFDCISIFNNSKEPRYLPSLQNINLMLPSFISWEKLPEIFGTSSPQSMEMEIHRDALKFITISASSFPPMITDEDSALFNDHDIDQDSLRRILWLQKFSDVHWNITSESESDMLALATSLYFVEI